jgi:hypothetical protein
MLLFVFRFELRRLAFEFEFEFEPDKAPEFESDVDCADAGAAQNASAATAIKPPNAAEVVRFMINPLSWSLGLGAGRVTPAARSLVVGRGASREDRSEPRHKRDASRRKDLFTLFITPRPAPRRF